MFGEVCLLFTEKEQAYLAEHIPGSFLFMIPSVYGHDGFLLEYEAITAIVNDFLQQKISPQPALSAIK